MSEKELRALADNDGAVFQWEARAAVSLIEAERAKVKALREALVAAKGYLLNTHIDLETGAPKRTAINTLSGGIRLVREALAATSDPIEAPSDVHPQGE